MPAMAATMPPMSIQTALSVGDPVKNRETSELKELVALMPKMIRATPPPSSARARILFIKIQMVAPCLTAHADSELKELPPGNEADEDHDDGDDQQDMNEAADGIGGHDSQEPENQQDDGNGCEKIHDWAPVNLPIL